MPRISSDKPLSGFKENFYFFLFLVTAIAGLLVWSSYRQTVQDDEAEIHRRDDKIKDQAEALGKAADELAEAKNHELFWHQKADRFSIDLDHCRAELDHQLVKVSKLTEPIYLDDSDDIAAMNSRAFNYFGVTPYRPKSFKAQDDKDRAEGKVFDPQNGGFRQPK